ncbi:exodeoxyribonuclease V subunit beta [Algicola sagamiensis]|uniref:exodeoxyribonuclease V subunit beta n=1 Tax=Algicola sagamiensis TaxID=163869 RepID=UPI0003798A85|nr:exodeoxyribonuclease V subunit beta [Algicola sagamiensis]
MKLLDPVQMPLVSENLIEASAGTGKTYTITTLYLRLLLGLSGAAGEHQEPLNIDQILVVTFTEAATEEIRERVRSKLMEAKDAVRIGRSNDPVLQVLLSQIDDQLIAYHRLDAAIKQMDLAAIFTIHGFCYRALQENAFESGILFQHTFTLDESDYIEQAALDTWRCHMMPLQQQARYWLSQVWRSPEEMMYECRPLLTKTNLTWKEEVSRAALNDLSYRYLEQIQSIKKIWLGEDIPALIEASDLRKDRMLAKSDRLKAMSQFCRSEQLTFAFGKSGIELWAQENIEKPGNLKGKKIPPSHEIFSMISQCAEDLAGLKDAVKGYWVPFAVTEIRGRLAKVKLEKQLLTPDDLLQQLSEALQSDDEGRLAEKVATQYPVAMIDEFQDTDPIQYHIFKTIYQHTSARSLIMIGDPKQAIYGFRGADIFTYIQAKQQVIADCQYTLGKNWRSMHSLVSCVNQLFEKSKSPFLYDDAIPFLQVESADQGKRTGLILHQQPIAPMLFWMLESDAPLSKAQAHPKLAAKCSAQIAALLNASSAGTATLNDQPVQSHDFAILVRDRYEAITMQRALNEHGIASVFLSRENVFQTPVAIGLLRVLRAMLTPENERLVKAALATEFFFLSIEELWQLGQDEKRWQHFLVLFQSLHRQWEKYGVMAAIQTLMGDSHLPAKWRQTRPEADRYLTDLRHLSEILQSRSLEVDGMHSLLQWFEERVLSPDVADKTQQLRLESDENLVRIVTMHASKGLEYPIVFLPFICGFSAAKMGLYHDDTQLIFDPTHAEASLESADYERLAEDLRLLYVALTRPIYHCYLGIFDLKDGRKSQTGLQKTAMGHLLMGQQQIDKEARALDLVANQLKQIPAEIAIEWFDEVQPEIFIPPQMAQSTNLHCAQFTSVLDTAWRVTSYSGLTYGQHQGGYDESPIKIEAFESVITDESLTPFTFPKGAKPGSCLHDMLEQALFESDTGVIESLLQKSLARFGIEEKWLPTCLSWIVQIKQYPFLPKTTSLEMLEPSQCKIEMPFMMSIGQITATRLSRWLRESIHPDMPALQFKTLKGMLKGFMDLVFVHDGRYYILDYKSNYLGDKYEDYQYSALEQAMNEHQYHLQYSIYTVALHRHLSRTIPEYHYEKHFGGIYYLFLRGMGHGEDGIYFTRPSFLFVRTLDQIMAGQEHSQSEKEQLSLWE